MRIKELEITPSRKVFTANYPHFRYWKQQAAAELLQPAPLNIYIHVPFCAQQCAYCYYKTEKVQSREQLETYVAALLQEIDLAERTFALGKRPVRTIYIGGGTPSLLGDDMLERITAALHENFTIADPEFTLEAEPRTVTEKRVTLYKKLGITRVSLGIQSFDDEIVRQSGRSHTAEKALQAIERVKEAEDIVVNIDLLSGLAGETMTSWCKSVDTAIASGVHNITVYKMEVYLNTEFFTKSVRKKTIELPSDEQELAFMRTAIDKFTAADYRPWSFFTFTRGGKFHHQYASNIWHGQDCCALGPSGFGVLNNHNYQNANEFDHYREMVKQGKLPIIRAHRLTGKDAMTRDLLMGMKLSRMSRGDFYQKHGVDFCRLIPDTVEELTREGYIEVDEQSVTLTAKGLLYGDYAGKRLAYALKKHLGLDELSLY